MALLRAEVLRFPRPDGGLDLLDLLLDALHSLSPPEAALLAELEAGAAESPAGAALHAKLEGALLWEGATAEALRRERHAARVHRWAEPEAAGPEPEPSWAPPGPAARELLAPAWQDPERYRRLREERLAGRDTFVLRGLLEPGPARALAAEVAELPFQRLVTAHVQAERCELGGRVPGLHALLLDPGFRALVGAVLGRALGAGLLLNAWRLGPGDRLGVHPDGPRYQATFSLGLCSEWRAAQGGAIAFGDPSPGGLEVRERFLPHLGDVCLFLPHARSWHAVERVRAGQRLSVTGWWLSA